MPEFDKISNKHNKKFQPEMLPDEVLKKVSGGLALSGILGQKKLGETLGGALKETVETTIETVKKLKK